MRKLLLTVALTATVAFANAQALTSKNGTPILPESGDWSIGFDAVPVLNYFGNLFNNTVNNSVKMDYPEGNSSTIVGRMMKDENTAYRAKIGINFSSSSVKYFVPDQTSTATPRPEVEDEMKSSSMNITIGAGIQKYRGKGRLKGIYGAEVMLGFGNGSGTTEYSYANNFDATSGVSEHTDFTDPLTPIVSTSSRRTETTSGSRFSFGVRGFVGVEYFFAPKMSLGAEYGWGIGISSQGEGETTTESADISTGTLVVKENTTKASGNNYSDFNIGVDNGGGTSIGSGTGAIMLNFYF